MPIIMLLTVIPPLFLLFCIYREDKVEKEPVGLIVKTVIFGMISVIPVMIVESILLNIIGGVVSITSTVGMILENFIGVALVEEFFKMQACKLSVWKNDEFNYTFDGVVYAVSSAIGFALLENFLYNITSGLATALIRCITAIPGHTIFGIFMGMHLGMAKLLKKNGDDAGARKEMILALVIPMLIHGFYDFLCSVGNTAFMIIFWIFLIALDILAIRKVKEFEVNDTMIL